MIPFHHFESWCSWRHGDTVMVVPEPEFDEAVPVILPVQLQAQMSSR